MIRHVVCFKLKEPTQEILEKAKEMLLSMKGKVPEVLDISVGIDILHSERSFDIILQVTVESMQALESYQKNSYHCEYVKPLMHLIRLDSVAVDYQLD